MKEIKAEKIANIGAVENITKRLTLKDLLKMLKKAEKNNDIVKLDQKDD